MAKRRKGRKKSSLSSLLIIVIIVLVAVFLKPGSLTGDDNVTVSDDVVKVHFIDVGQGSSSLIQKGSVGILIDAGETDYGNAVVKYIKSVGVKKLKYVVASHPHSDHIGGMTKVINSFDIETFIMPEIADENVPTSRCYTNMLNALASKESTDVVPSQFGEKFKLGNDVAFTILGPVVQNNDLNDMSVIVKANVNGTRFLFPADAEKTELSSIMNKNADVRCDVMAMAHHGSSTSLLQNYLNQANFSVAVISCGKDNSYGHPHREILNWLKTNKKTVYRTDKSGSIIFECKQGTYSVSFGEN